MQINEIKELIKVFESSQLSFFELEQDNSHIKMKKSYGETVVTTKKPQTVAPLNIENDNFIAIKSPVVGVFYRASSPESAPFVEVGSKVKEGDVIGLIEAMKMMSEIKAPVSGTVRSIDAKNEQLVAFDDVLIKIEE